MCIRDRGETDFAHFMANFTFYAIFSAVVPTEMCIRDSIVDVQNSVYAVCRLDHRGTENESAQAKDKRADDDKGCDTRDNTDCQFIVASFWRLERRGRWSVGIGHRGLVSCARIGRLRGRGGAGARLGLGARLACRRAGTVRGLCVCALRR